MCAPLSVPGSASKAVLEAAITDLQAKVAAGTALGVQTTGVDGLLQSVTVKQAELGASSRTAAESARTMDAEIAGSSLVARASGAVLANGQGNDYLLRPYLVLAAAQSDSEKAVRDAQSQIKGAAVSLARIEAKLGISGSGNSTNSTNTTAA